MTRDGYGVMRSTNYFINKQLLEGGGKMFREIKQYLENNEIRYSNKGLHLRLESLIRQRKIEKKHIAGKPYPTYHRIDKGTDFSAFGAALKFSIEDRCQRNEVLARRYRKNTFFFMTKLIGVYALFAEIQSWKLSSKTKSAKEKFDIRSSFLGEALPLLTVSSRTEFDGSKYNLPFELDIYENDKFQNAILKYEKFLEKNFHDEYEICIDALESATKLYKLVTKIRKAT